MINGNRLIVDIKSVASILNFRSRFVPARYAIILLAAIRDPMFEDFCIQPQNCKYINYYQLEGVADTCSLIFHRGKTAEKVYRYLESKQRVQFLKQDNHTFITLTKKGQRKYKERLKEFIELKLSASSHDKGLETNGQSISLAKGVRIKPRRITKVKSISDKESIHQVTGDNHQYLIQI